MGFVFCMEICYIFCIFANCPKGVTNVKTASFTYKTEPCSDVLVIGGGLAGMYAALAAAESGAAVRILCKSKTGGSGNSVVAMSVHRFAPDAPGLREDYRRRFLASGAGQQNAETAAFFVDHAAAAMERLRGFGLPLEYRTLSENGEEYPYLACCSPKQGRILTKAVRGKLNEHPNITVEDGVTVCDILTGHGRAQGALALCGGELRVYPAKAVILGCGGAGGIYAATSNTRDVTGDGYAMAARCGLPLQGMEFVQFYPYRIYSPGRADIFPDLFDHGAVLRNEKGERFMDCDRYPMKELENRDVVARAEFAEKEVRLDLSGCDKAYLERECPNIARMARDNPDKPLLIRPVAHFFMGGVPLRTDCATDVAGLYACGEVTGGLHGANRLAGSALTETVVFGLIAGENAAKYAAADTAAPETDAAADRILSGYPELGADSLRDLRSELRETMQKDVSVIRTQEGMERALGGIGKLRDALRERRPASLAEWNELRSMLATAESVTRAALERKESLGAHCRVG